MIIRIVKMTFRDKEASVFVKIFDTSKDKIRNYPGCMHLKLLRDKNASNIFYTYSHWEDETFLNEYRQSELFIDTWKRTKALFEKKAEAYSTIIIDELI